MKSSIVLGGGFGDEAKGSFTNYLCRNLLHNGAHPLVIRFNGGHQAGHTVLENGKRHIFSSFGSASLQDVPTYWSRFCTIYPTAVFNEYETLKKLGIEPNIYFDPLCPITTPLDILANQLEEKRNGHGTVGVGFGTTLKRHEAYYKLYYQDLFNKTILEAKIKNIFGYYSNLYYTLHASNDDMEKLEVSLQNWHKCIDSLIKEEVFSKENMGTRPPYDYVVFEGAQGILLDMDFGFFPNVTRSNTTSKNVFTLIKELNLDIKSTPKVYYITRAYQTRHGSGFMTNEDLDKPTLINIENEINVDGGNQGTFRKSILDLDLISYAIQCDNNFSKHCEKHIVISCLDQIEGEQIKYTINKELYSSNVSELKIKLSELTGINSFKIITGESEGIFLQDQPWRTIDRFIPYSTYF